MSTLYATTGRKSTTWFEPFETVYQAQQRERGKRSGRGHRPDITWPLRLLIASAVALGESRPHGMITWLAEVLETSRQTIYDIGKAWAAREADEAQALATEEAESPGERRNRLARTVLTLLVAGSVSLRGVQLCLKEILGDSCSLGWLSELVNEAGQRAGAALAAADWSGATELILARDELFFGDTAWLTLVDTKSHAVVGGHVEDAVDAETWAVALAVAELQTGFKITGLTEDGGSWYPASISKAQELLDSPFRAVVQKDTWHVLTKAGQVLCDADRIALRCLEKAEKKASWFRPGLMRIHDFKGWEKAHEQADRAISVADSIRTAVDLLPEVLDLVDRRTHAILDRDTAQWYLEQIQLHLHGIDSDLAASLAGSLETQGHELLTFHDWLALGLAPWRAATAEHFEEPELADLFERAVARAWHLSRALTNGRTGLRRAADHAADEVRSLCQNDPTAELLAKRLFDLLDGTARTSSAAENFNSFIRAYIWGRRFFRDRRTAQNWFNLLLLWYNLHSFQRGKRKGHSPFELAGVVVHRPDGRPTTDWLEAMGYAEAA